MLNTLEKDSVLKTEQNTSSSVARSWAAYEEVTIFGTDNAHNVAATLNLLQFQNMPCAAHSLQLSVKKDLQSLKLSASLLKAANLWDILQ